MWSQQWPSTEPLTYMSYLYVLHEGFLHAIVCFTKSLTESHLESRDAGQKLVGQTSEFMGGAQESLCHRHSTPQCIT